MIKTKSTKITFNGTILGNGEIPIICPHCGICIEPTFISKAYNLFGPEQIATLIFKGNCCDQLSFATYKVNLQNKTYELLSVYPPTKPIIFDEAIQQISPRFIESYNQAYSAEILNHFELAGAGYRNALEILIKDYAINILKKDNTEVSKKKLYAAIAEYVPEHTISAADVVRLLGNDFTHYERKYDHLGLNELKSYLEIYILAVKLEYKKKNPPISVNR